MGRDGRVTRVDSLWADPSDPALDRLGWAFQVGQRRQIAGGLLIGIAVEPEWTIRGCTRGLKPE